MPVIPIITAEEALPRVGLTITNLIKAWHSGFRSLDRTLGTTWEQGRLGGIEYALSLLLATPQSDVHDALMAGELLPSP